MFSIDKNYIKEQDELIEKLENEIVNLNKKIHNLQTEKESSAETNNYSSVKKELEDEIQEKQRLEEVINSLEEKVDMLNKRLEGENHKEDKQDLNKLVDENQEKISQLEQDKYELQTSLSRMEEQVRERDLEISSLMEKIKDIDNKSSESDKDEYKDRIEKLEDRINNKDAIIKKMEQDLNDFKEKLEEKSIETMIDEQSIVKDEETIIQYEEKIRKLEEIIEENKHQGDTVKTDLVNYLNKTEINIDDVLYGESNIKSISANIGYITLSNFYDIQNEEGIEKSSELLKFWNNKVIEYIQAIKAYPLSIFSNTILFFRLTDIDNNNNLEVSFPSLFINVKKEIFDYTNKNNYDIVQPNIMGCFHTGNINVVKSENTLNPIMITGENLVIPSAVIPVMKEKNVQFSLTSSTINEISSDSIETEFVTDLKLKGREQRIKLYELINIDEDIQKDLRNIVDDRLLNVEINTENPYENIDDNIEDDLESYNTDQNTTKEEIDIDFEEDNDDFSEENIDLNDLELEEDIDEDKDSDDFDIDDDLNESMDYTDEQLEDFDIDEDKDSDDFDFSELDDVLIDEDDIDDDENL